MTGQMRKIGGNLNQIAYRLNSGHPADETLRAEVMEMCHREGLYQIDLLNGSRNRITNREYLATLRGQEALDRQNALNKEQGMGYQLDGFLEGAFLQNRQPAAGIWYDKGCGCKKREEKMKETALRTKQNLTVPVLIMLASALLRAYYVDYVSIYDLQHDAGFPYTLNGHLGYITYLMNTGHLPDFNLLDAYQFWHPPLHHALCALLLKTVWRILPQTAGNIEIIQLLPYLAVTVSIGLLYKMLTMLAPGKERAQNFALLFAAFQPVLFHFSASVNNDAGALMMSLFAVFFALRWYNHPSVRDVVLLALSVGAGMWIKMNVIQMIVPAGILFLFKTVSDKRNLKKYLAHGLLFFLIAMPVGLFWYVRVWVLWRVPFAYSYYLEDMVGYLGNESVWKRLLNFDPRYFSIRRTYLQFHDPVWYDVNPLIALVKTAANGVWSIYNKYALLLATAVLWLWMITGALTGAGIFLRLKRKKDPSGETDTDAVCQDNGVLLAMLALAASQLASYYLFAFKTPCTWGMDFRYITPVLLCMAVFLISFMESGKRRRQFAQALCVLFAVTVSVYFLALRLYFTA